MTAHFVLSKGKLLDQFSKISTVCDIVSFSLKTNVVIGGLLESLTDCFFSVHSLSLLSNVHDKSRVLFFPQGWRRSDVKKLLDLGVENFVVDNVSDLKVLLDFLDENKELEVNLFLRMRLRENSVRTGKHYVYGFFSREVNEWIPKLKKNIQIGSLGIHFHRKTQNINEWSLLSELQDSLNDNVLESIDFLNIGGGFPAEYKNSKTSIDVIFRKVLELKDWVNRKGIELICEPGRFIAASPIDLVCNIKSIVGSTVIINCSVYNSSMDTFIADTRLLVKGEVDKSNFMYLIKGETPDSADIFRYRVYFSREINEEEDIIFLNAGAYNFSSNFWGLKPLKTIVID